MSEYVINLRSSQLPGMTDLNVLVPGPAIGANAKEFYGSGKKYKVLWLLHGGFGDRNDWLRYTCIGRYAEERAVIVVMPSGLNSDFANHPQFADRYNFSDFFLNELLPFICNWFPASDKPEDNIIAGFSMGAPGAWMYGLQRPDLFGGIAPIAGSSPLRNYTFLEAYRNVSSSEFRALAQADNKSIPTGYGDPKSGIKVKEINMVTKYPTVGAFLDSAEHTWYRFREAVAAGRLPKIYLPCGTDDERNHQAILQFKQYADELGAKDITYDFVPGAVRGWDFCDHILPKVMDFFDIK